MKALRIGMTVLAVYAAFDLFVLREKSLIRSLARD